MRHQSAIKPPPDKGKSPLGSARVIAWVVAVGIVLTIIVVFSVPGFYPNVHYLSEWLGLATAVIVGAVILWLHGGLSRWLAKHYPPEE